MLTWQPSASLKNLQARARILKQIRDFFAARDVLEVDTPLMCHTSVTDPFIQSIPALFQAHGAQHTQQYYLQTSPEYAMKRLLAAGSSSIYQICKAFRQGDLGQLHNPEFTMLEWYRTGFNHHQLMDEMDALLQLVLQCNSAVRMSYGELFQTYLAIDPHGATLAQLAQCAKQHAISMATAITDKDTWLDVLMTHCIEPQLGQDRPCFIFDFPASQAALARIQPGNPPLAARFEVYCRGMELANGFYELQDAQEQRRRFEHNLQRRAELGLSALPIDELFLAALAQGLPDCAGVALGIDRLIMVALGSTSIADVVSFDFPKS